MKYKALGNSDILVSEVSFGCMSLGEDHDYNYNLLRHAVHQGITLFDTADLYNKGNNEITLGNAFKGIRDKVIISTKVGNQWRSDGSGWDWNPGKEYIFQAAEASLRRLQTDYIDLYLLHGGMIEDPIDETIDAFEILKQQGKIREYGISSIRPNVIREYVKKSSIAAVMMQYSLLDRRPEESCFSLLQENNISILTRGSLAKGLLVNKEASPYLNYTKEEVEQAAAIIKAVGGDKRKAAEVAVRFVLDQEAVTSAVLGIRTLQQLEEAIYISSTVPLQEEDINKLKSTLRPSVYDQHR